MAHPRTTTSAPAPAVPAPAAAPVPAPKPSDALRLPVQALRLAGRNWARLLFWFSVSFLVHDLLLRAAAATAEMNKLAGVAVLALAVLATLITTILMFHALRRDLPGLTRMVRAHGDGEYPDTWSERQGRFIDVLGETLLPFLIFYTAWGMLAETGRQYVLMGNIYDQHRVLEVNLWWALGIAVPCWVVGSLCERWFWRKRNVALGVGSALLEAGWIFFGLFSVSRLIGNALNWVTSRLAWYETGHAMGNVVHAYAAVIPFLEVPHLELAWQAVQGGLGDLKDGLLLPLLWLAIAAVIFGNEMQSERDLVEDNRALQRLGGAVDKLPSFTRRLAAIVSLEAREKYVPALNGLRMVLRAGAPVYLFFCVCYVALDHMTNWMWVGITRLIGPHERWFWDIWLEPLNFGTEMVHEVLRVCLLAVTFDLVLRLVNARSAGDVTLPGSEL